jgi:hypothetical protein
MPSARELLEQADALMRRNRARAVDTEIPELTEVVVASAPAPAAMVVALDDVPELVDAVEEIEIASIVELPDDIDESSGWSHHEFGDWSVMGREADSIVARLPVANAPESDAGHVRSLWSIVGKPGAAADRIPAVERAPPAIEPVPPAAEPPPTTTESAPPVAEPAPPAMESAPPVAETAPLAMGSAPPVAEPAPLAMGSAPPVAEPAPPAPSQPPIADDWARWEALAEEIRMQVLQRIDIFTDTRLRKQLSAQLQPIVDRASVQMVETVNEEIGKLLRAYIAEAIEREIEKWRGKAE